MLNKNKLGNTRSIQGHHLKKSPRAWAYNHSVQDLAAFPIKGLITLISGCMFQKTALPCHFMHFFSRFYTCIKFLQKPLVTSVISYKFQKNPCEVSFYTHFFHDFIHVYSSGAGADYPLGTKFWCQQEHLVTSVICCLFQKNLFEVWFYTFCFMILYMYIAPGQEQTAPGDKVLM